MEFERWMAKVRPDDKFGKGPWYELAAAYRAGFDENPPPPDDLDAKYTWHGVVKECEKILGCTDTAEKPLTSNLPNLIRDLKSRPDLGAMREDLAALAHDQWSGWMKYMFDHWEPKNIERWKRQMVTPYKDLPEHSKESDRKEADRYLKILGTPPDLGAMLVRLAEQRHKTPKEDIMWKWDSGGLICVWDGEWEEFDEDEKPEWSNSPLSAVEAALKAEEGGTGD